MQETAMNLCQIFVQVSGASFLSKCRRYLTARPSDDLQGHYSGDITYLVMVDCLSATSRESS